MYCKLRILFGNRVWLQDLGKSIRKSMLLELSFQLQYSAPQRIISGAPFGDGFGGVQDIGVGSAKKFADLVAGKSGKFTAEEHCHHPRVSDVTGAAFADHIGESDPEVVGDELLNGFRSDIARKAFFCQLSVKEVFGFVDREVLGSAHFGVSREAQETPFQPSDRTGNIFCEKFQNGIRQGRVGEMSLAPLTQDDQTLFIFRHTDLAGHTLFKTAAETAVDT